MLGICRRRLSFSVAVAAVTGMVCLLLSGSARSAEGSDGGQTGRQAERERGTIVLPFELDHNRILVDVELRLADGSAEHVRGWVDTGNPQLWATRRVAGLLDLDGAGRPVKQGGADPLAVTSRAVFLGGVRVPLPEEPAASVAPSDRIAPGLDAELNLPSTLLRNYDILVDYPRRRVTMAPSGALTFQGEGTAVFVNEANGLVQVPSSLDGVDCNLGLDLGASFSLLSGDVFRKLATAHPAWPRMTGAVGLANFWGLPDEAEWSLLQVRRLLFGRLSLEQVGVASIPEPLVRGIVDRAGTDTVGLLGGNALAGRHIGIAYSRRRLYVDGPAHLEHTAMDVVGVILRPERDGRYSIVGVAKVAGQPVLAGVEPGDVLVSVDGVPTKGVTMGRIWSMLSGTPGQLRELRLETNGNVRTVRVPVQRFLADPSPQ
jgi:hypothetical protein